MKHLFAILLISLASQAYSQHQCHFTEVAKQQRLTLGKTNLTRPPADAFVVSNQFPIKVHYVDAVGVEYATEILSYLETSWQVEFLEMGFLPPHADGDLGGDSRFDVYLVDDLDPQIGGYASFSGFNEETDRADAFGFLVINNQIDIRIRRFVVAHELFHASQMAYDWWEDLAFMESSATWIVDHVFDDEDIYWKFFPYFNQQPFLALDYVSLKNPYQYGSAMWPLFLDESLGEGDGVIVRKIWEGTVQNSFDNEPDFLDVIATLAEDRGGLSSIYRSFGEWRLAVGERDNGLHFQEAAIWGDETDPYFEVEANAGTQMIQGDTRQPLGPYSHAFLNFKRRPEEVKNYRFQIENLGQHRLAVDLMLIQDSQQSMVRLGVIEGNSFGEFLQSNLRGYEELNLIITNITDGSYDADTSPWTGQGFRYRFEALEVNP